MNILNLCQFGHRIRPLRADIATFALNAIAWGRRVVLVMVCFLICDYSVAIN